ncbi:hypothetical protein S225a_11340 [Candidatus Brocadiaceae bacterium S225]|uniref:Uncharacterized protein n=1 Tax=Candidatus Scalindua brodae TaxID=237368 RepID=A0A0B0EP61_9BACT|nr:MAG: hypothetical protein SCABRO_01835 [Candidatus Scalindua brodae]TWU34776.1 hypothetical protein S225a_11340 [Candidatus Brocadiaceae bacterium S225]
MEGRFLERNGINTQNINYECRCLHERKHMNVFAYSSNRGIPYLLFIFKNQQQETPSSSEAPQLYGALSPSFTLNIVNCPV